MDVTWTPTTTEGVSDAACDTVAVIAVVLTAVTVDGPTDDVVEVIGVMVTTQSDSQLNMESGEKSPGV